MNSNDTRLTLRDLPLPAKLVISTFLISVGLGYCWAMMQVHFKHASSGSLLPTLNDVVERFSGQHAPWDKGEIAAANNKPADHAAGKLVAGAKIKSIIDARCVVCHGPEGEKDELPFTTFAQIRKVLDPSPEKSKFHKVVAKEDDENFTKDNMTQAFTKKSTVKIGDDELEWKNFIKLHPEKEGAIRAEREVERMALKAWLEAGAPEDAYEKDAFALPEELRLLKVTPGMETKAPERPKEADLAGHGAVTKKRNPKDRQLSVESLTQSTHAHLLSFAMLWALTGFVFAFTSYSYWLRVGIAPAVLIMQIVDIMCWWMARLPDVGPYFAVAVMGTGGLVGLGLTVQIVLSLFNMYSGKGKSVLLALFLVAAVGGGLVYTKYIAPHILAEKEAGN